jgi:hypothetical protein
MSPTADTSIFSPVHGTHDRDRQTWTHTASASVSRDATLSPIALKKQTGAFGAPARPPEYMKNNMGTHDGVSKFGATKPPSRVEYAVNDDVEERKRKLAASAAGMDVDPKKSKGFKVRLYICVSMCLPVCIWGCMCDGDERERKLAASAAGMDVYANKREGVEVCVYVYVRACMFVRACVRVWM